ncbi:AfsR/SARP family transcriptional regulator [Cellulomonas sp. S1-8]|uniref:AfsR/SARP family transcriptional regulator n=1 Tax=Cellulomonas sp. S1-8 TaxID=2904790 RepID=UPI002243BC5B|nr:BTAD domain-containing putative transcriptional regulator [Cellulomonas sp. S1-8]UZN03131.1 BTAD domain-containing putative transcriptional regulator [Cellulomonas sp. S1-8]
MPRLPEPPHIRLLGTPCALVDDLEVDLGAPKQRAVLAALALRAGQAVGHDALIDGTWGAGAPASARGSVHTYVSGLRHALGKETVRRTPTGYMLAVPPDAVDVLHAERQARRARDAHDAADLATAQAALDAALALWHEGDALAGVPGPFAAEHRARLAQLRVRLLVDRTEILAAAGADATTLAHAADRLAAEVPRHPYDERLRGALMVALHHSGRTAAALEQYEDLRRSLSDDLGIDPGAAARALHATILADGDVGAVPVLGATPVVAARTPTSTVAVPAPGAPSSHGPGAPSAPGPGAPSPAPRPAAQPRVPAAQLPPDLATFVGRSRELLEVLRLAGAPEGPRIVTVVGVGGVGKTSLAVRAGHMLRDRFPDGQVYVNLRGFDPRHPPVAPSAALRQLLAALGVLSAPQQHEQLVALWRSLVADRRLLVVLDNAASTEQVEDLLPGTASSFVLVTSRDRLGGLAVRHGARALPLARFEPAEARELLEGALGTAAVAREPDAAQRLVQLCDALPFALRIAAEQVLAGAGASIEAMVARLEDSQHRLDALDLDDGPSASVRGVLATSTAALDDPQSRTLCLLAALPCASTSVLATAALMDVAPDRAAQLLDELREHHLLEPVDGRHLMHDLTRAHAAELAEHLSDDERAAARERLLTWYVRALVASSRQRLLPFEPPVAPHALPVLPDNAARLRWALAELANMASLLREGHAHGHHTLVWQLAVLLFETYYASGGASDWLDVLRVGSRSAQALGDSRAQAVLLNHESVACSRLGRNDAAVRRLREALRLLEGDRWWYRVSIVGNLASTLREAGEYAGALAAAHDAYALSVELGDGYYEVASADVLCELSAELGEWRQAERYGEPALALARAEGHRVLEANLLVNLGLAADGLRDHDAAQQRFAQALDLCAAIGDRYHEALALFGLARVRTARDGRAGEEQARRDAERALRRFRQLGAEEAGAVQDFLARLSVGAEPVGQVGADAERR